MTCALVVGMTMTAFTVLRGQSAMANCNYTLDIKTSMATIKEIKNSCYSHDLDNPIF